MVDIRGAIAQGADQAEQMVQDNRPGGSFEKTDWFGLEDKETMILRFLHDHDEWYSVMQHVFTATRPAPPDYPADRTWPKQMGAVCRKTKQFAPFFPDGCYICDHMHEVRPNPKTKNKKWFPAVRLWAIAVVREEVRATNAAEAERYGVGVGQVAGYRDAEIESDEIGEDGKPTGNKVMKKRTVVVNMAWKNFYSPLQGYANVYGTVLDRDYHITRKGSGTDTDYMIVPMNPITRSDGTVLDLRTTMEVVGGKETGRTRKQAYLEDFSPDPIQLIEDRLSDDLFDKFFDDRHAYPEFKGGNKEDGDKGSAPAAGSSQNGAAKEAPSEADQQGVKDRLAAMRARVKGDHVPAAEEEPPAEERQPATVAAGRPSEFD